MASNRVPCPSCKGLGSFREKTRDPKSEKEKERFRKCKVCKGKGYTMKPDRWSPR